MVAIRIPVFDRDSGKKPPPAAWTIRVEQAALQSHTFALQAKDGCYVSAHTKLAGWSKRVVLSTEALASDYLAAMYPIMRKRHGNSIALTVEGTDKSDDGQLDDAVALARIGSRNFAPNVIPSA